MYTQGIVKSQMRNIERINEELGTHYHQMQHFITESNWDGRQVIDKVAKEVSSALGNPIRSEFNMMINYDSSCPKYSLSLFDRKKEPKTL